VGWLHPQLHTDARLRVSASSCCSTSTLPECHAHCRAPCIAAQCAAPSSYLHRAVPHPSLLSMSRCPKHPQPVLTSMCRLLQVLASYILIMGAVRQARGFLIGLLATTTVLTMIATDRFLNLFSVAHGNNVNNRARVTL